MQNSDSMGIATRFPHTKIREYNHEVTQACRSCLQRSSFKISLISNELAHVVFRLDKLDVASSHLDEAN